MTGLGDILHYYYSLADHELPGSITILGDFLLANCSELGLDLYPQHHFRVTIHYADSLYGNQQFRRALNYYALGLKLLKRANFSFDPHLHMSETDVKWRTYKCYMDLKEPQQALSELLKIPKDQRDAKSLMAMAKLFQQVRNDDYNAVIFYKQSLRICPLAMEAILGLLSLGLTLEDVISSSLTTPTTTSIFSSTTTATATTDATSGSASAMTTDQLPCTPITHCTWLYKWLEAESDILKMNYSGAVTKFNELTLRGMKLSADSNCQLAFCMNKLGRNESAKELFTIASIQDVHVLNHMDMFARLLAQEQRSTHTYKLDRLCAQLLHASCLHPEPWVAKAWLLLSSEEIAVSMVEAHIRKALAVRSSAEALYAEGFMRSKCNEFNLASFKLSEALYYDLTFFEAYNALIQCYLKSRSHRDALHIAKMSSSHLPPAQYLYLQGTVLGNSTATLSKAVCMLEKAIKLDKNFEVACLLLGKLYCKMGCIKSAARMLSNQLSGHSSSAIHVQLAGVLLQQRQHNGALEHYHRALYLDPECKAAKEGLKTLDNSLSESVEIQSEEEEEMLDKEAVLTPFQAHINKDSEGIGEATAESH